MDITVAREGGSALTMAERRRRRFCFELWSGDEGARPRYLSDHSIIISICSSYSLCVVVASMRRHDGCSFLSEEEMMISSFS